MEKVINKRIIAACCAVFLIMTMIVAPVHAYTGNGIKNNGLDGITINIYGSPYSEMAKVPTWGQYAYGSEGCAWFATSRAKQLTGKNITTIFSGTSWYNTQYANYGFTRGSTIRAKALACYSGHIAVVEQVNGDTVTISEGGNTSYPSNDYCVIRHRTISQVQSNGFLGYVYLGVSGGGGSPSVTANFSPSVSDITNTSAKLNSTLTLSGASISQVSKVGVRLYDNAGNELWWKEEPVSYNTSYINIWYEVGSGKEIGVALSPGTTYKYQFYAVVSGTTYKDSMRTFKTTGEKPVTSIRLNKVAFALQTGDSETLTATVVPSDATNKTVTWSTSDSSVATVSNGKVTAKKAGIAKITAKAGSASTICTVTVTDPEIPITAVSLDKHSMNLTVGGTGSLSATISPSNANTSRQVEWQSSDTSVATVQNGLVTAKKAGTAVITVVTVSGGKKDTCTVTVSAPAPATVPVSSVSLDKTAMTMTAGDSGSLTATVNPSNATNKAVTWSSSDASVATVSNGSVSAKKAGTAVVTAKAGDKTATCTVTVKAKESAPTTVPVSSVALDKKTMTLTVGDAGTLIASILPSNATDKAVNWSSSDSSVAEGSGGVVKAKKAGTALITAKAGDKEASCAVTVQEKSSSGGIQHGSNCISARYSDVVKDESNWTHLPIDYVLEKGYMAGMSNTQFAPNGTVTRAQIVQILYAREGKPAVSNAKKFNDVASGMWYSNAIGWASSNSVVAGYTDGSFKPDQAITREQMVTILRAYAGYKGQDVTASGNVNSFADAGKISNYALQSVRWAVGKSLISGTGKGIEPQGTATRAQIAVILKAYDTNISK